MEVDPVLKIGLAVEANLAEVNLPAAKHVEATATPVEVTEAKPAAPKPVVKPQAAGPVLPLNEVLAKGRRWIDTHSYLVKNTYTGCWGLAHKNSERTRAELTIAHSADCECMDVRLLHICQHADRMVKQGHVAKRFRDDFVIAIKTRRRLPQPLPQAVRFHAGRKQVVKRDPAEREADNKIVNVVDSHNGQRLVEKWKSLKAWKERLIWKDW
ncbi:hypothetical protein F5Y19DRAFT_226471 [Xylariaceae sp. FL1651]|nr:hypothetical protein F5Y19DRAFT_226471 [Xylariaceae sp. FL1651]